MTLHRFRLIVLLDTLVYQQRLGLDGVVMAATSAGGGFSMIISGRRGSHFRTRLYLAQPLAEGGTPVLYWQTSLFNLVHRL